MVQKLASEFFWPRFQKQDGCHGRFIQIFRDFCCPSMSKGMQCTQICRICSSWSKLPWELFWITGQKQDRRCECFFDRFLQNTKSANISKTVISSEFLTRRVVQEYAVAI